MTIKIFRNGYSVECWWTAVFEVRISYHTYDQRTSPALRAQFITLGIYFPFGTKFSWNEETHTCFNVERVLLGRNFDVLGGYLVVNVRYLMVTTGYWSLPGGYWLLQVVTARYRSLLLVPTFSLNGSGNTLDENN